jgi:DNA polymerase III delta prime subunit
MQSTDNKVAPKLWTEALRPKKLDELLTFPRVKEILKDGITTNLFFCGSPGIGKSSVSRILAKDYNTLEINCSLERGIDTLREKIMSFCVSTDLTFDDDNSPKKIKLVQLEEADNATTDFYMALRALMEQFANKVFFICNLNHPEKVPDPIKSRFTIVDMDPRDKEEADYLLELYKARIKQILAYVKIAYTEETLDRFVRRFFPDMRSIVKTMQAMHDRGCVEIPKDISYDGSDLSPLFQLIASKPDAWNNYQALYLEYSAKPETGIIEIGKSFPKWMHENHPEWDVKIPTCLIAIAEHQGLMAQAADHFVVFMSLVFKLQLILNQ